MVFPQRSSSLLDTCVAVSVPAQCGLSGPLRVHMLPQGHGLHPEQAYWSLFNRERFSGSHPIARIFSRMATHHVMFLGPTLWVAVCIWPSLQPVPEALLSRLCPGHPLPGTWESPCHRTPSSFFLFHAALLGCLACSLLQTVRALSAASCCGFSVECMGLRPISLDCELLNVGLCSQHYPLLLPVKY